jgi:hypothetical protein
MVLPCSIAKLYGGVLSALALLIVIGLITVNLTNAHAGTIVYDNTTTAPISNISFNGATIVGANLIANMDADDIIVDASFAGHALTALTFLAFNPNTTAVTARPTFFLWAADGVGGNPGTFLEQYVLPVTTFAPGISLPLIVSDSSESVLIPSTGRFWAGVVFDDNNGTTGITPTQLDLLGGQVFNPPTVGTSDGLVAVFQPPALGPPNVDNPQVIPFQFGNNPPVNYGWRFEAQAVVPEPSSLVLFLSGFGVGVFIVARRNSRLTNCLSGASG